MYFALFLNLGCFTVKVRVTRPQKKTSSPPPAQAKLQPRQTNPSVKKETSPERIERQKSPDFESLTSKIVFPTEPPPTPPANPLVQAQHIEPETIPEAEENSQNNSILSVEERQIRCC